MSLSKAIFDESMKNIEPSFPKPVYVSREQFVQEFLSHFGKDAECFPMNNVDEDVVNRAIAIFCDQWSFTPNRFDLTTNIKHIRDIVAEMDQGAFSHKDIPDYDERSHDTCGQIGCGARLPKLWSKNVTV